MTPHQTRARIVGVYGRWAKIAAGKNAKNSAASDTVRSVPPTAMR